MPKYSEKTLNDHPPSLTAKQLELDRKECLRRIERCNKRKNRKLNLSFLYLRELPEELEALYWSEILNLHNTWITELPNWVSNLKNLVKLDISNNDITKYPDVVYWLPV